jgi:hypothetical protein
MLVKLTQGWAKLSKLSKYFWVAAVIVFEKERTKLFEPELHIPRLLRP